MRGFRAVSSFKINLANNETVATKMHINAYMVSHHPPIVVNIDTSTHLKAVRQIYAIIRISIICFFSAFSSLLWSNTKNNSHKYWVEITLAITNPIICCNISCLSSQFFVIYVFSFLGCEKGAKIYIQSLLGLISILYYLYGMKSIMAKLQNSTKAQALVLLLIIVYLFLFFQGK